MVPAIVNAQGLQFPGGRGLTHLHTAWTLDKGTLTLHTNATSYSKTILLRSGQNPASRQTFWNIQGAMGLNYASGNNVEFSITNLLYQDSHLGGKGYKLPYALTIGAKIGSFGSRRSHFKVGVLLESRIPLSTGKNIPFEPYSGGNIEGGITGLLSYTADLLIPEAGLNMHANIGIWHNNDVGASLTNIPADNIFVRNSSRQLIWGYGMMIPTNRIDMALEIKGANFIVRPPVTAYSREDYIYLTPSLSIRPNNKLAFTAGFDIRLSKDVDLTRYVQDGTVLRAQNSDLPGLPDWRMRLNGKYYLTRKAPREIEKPLFTRAEIEELEAGSGIANKMPMQDRLVREKRKTEIAEEELEKIRKDRKKMEDMLARLRQILRYGKETQSSKLTIKKEDQEEDDQ